METHFIDPQHLLDIASGDKERTLKYLLRFQELIPVRIEKLKNSMQSEDRKMTRQILHQMSPQIQFFGIPDVVENIKKLEVDYKTMPMDKLKLLVASIITKLHLALKDVELILEKDF